jgi:hypothetical protein
MKLILGITVGLMVALLAGWIWGRSGRSDIARALEAAELRSELRGARAAVLDARVAIYSINFGEASGHLENARNLLRRADERLKSLGRDDEVRQVQTALTSMLRAPLLWSSTTRALSSTSTPGAVRDRPTCPSTAVTSPSSHCSRSRV